MKTIPQNSLMDFLTSNTDIEPSKVNIKLVQYDHISNFFNDKMLYICLSFLLIILILYIIEALYNKKTCKGNNLSVPAIRPRVLVPAIRPRVLVPAIRPKVLVPAIRSRIFVPATRPTICVIVVCLVRVKIFTVSSLEIFDKYRPAGTESLVAAVTNGSNRDDATKKLIILYINNYGVLWQMKKYNMWVELGKIVRLDNRTPTPDQLLQTGRAHPITWEAYTRDDPRSQLPLYNPGIWHTGPVAPHMDWPGRPHPAMWSNMIPNTLDQRAALVTFDLQHDVERLIETKVTYVVGNLDRDTATGAVQGFVRSQEFITNNTVDFTLDTNRRLITLIKNETAKYNRRLTALILEDRGYRSSNLYDAHSSIKKSLTTPEILARFSEEVEQVNRGNR